MQNFWSRPVQDVPEQVLFTAIDVSTELYRQSLLKRFINNKAEDVLQAEKTALRPSNLGKPAVDLFGMRFFPELYQDGEGSAQLNHIFHMGDTWECDALFYFAQRGIEVLDVQPTINWRGKVTGTADAVVCINGIRYVVDFKSVNSSYFKSNWDRTLDVYHLPAHLTDCAILERIPSVLKALEQTATLNNRRGYITQMSLYSDALHMPPMLLMLNKDTSEVVEGYFTVDERDAALHRVEQIVHAWEQVTCWEDVFQYIKPPPVRKEYKEKKWTGRYMPHMSMYNSPIIELVYELLPDDDGKLIVVDYRYPEQWKHLKPELP
jgi:hypothetical protein